MLTADFDVTIDSILPPHLLWRLVVEAFESSEESPLWPSELETLEMEELQEGARVHGTYQLGPVSADAAYRIAHYQPGRAFSYETLEPHPLSGGGTVRVEAGPHGTSLLRWSGTYRPRRLAAGLVALLFVRGYFLETFFDRLRTNLHTYERERDIPSSELRGVQPGETSLHANADASRSKERS